MHAVVEQDLVSIMDSIIRALVAKGKAVWPRDIVLLCRHVRLSGYAVESGYW